jgi:2-dehydropantoate 2-reductase
VRIRIVGAGSMGMLFAGKISCTGIRVELITHTMEQRDKLNNKSLCLLENGIEQSIHVWATYCASVDYSESEASDWIFLMVKQKDITDSLFKQLKPFVNEGTRFLCFQNGLGHLEKVQHEFPENQVYAAVTTEAARKISDDIVEHTGFGITWFGKIEKASSKVLKWDEQEKNLQNLLINAGFEVYLSNKMNSLIWNKLILNSVINPLTAILGIHNGGLLCSPPLRDLMKNLLEEGCTVAHQLDVEIADDLWEQLLQVCERTANNHSSMLQDINEGRVTELEWINGALLKCAKFHQLSLPSHDVLYRMVKHLESR